MENIQTEKHLSAFEAGLNQKCPKCRKGNMFKTPAYNLRHFYDMHDNCPVCNLRFEVEPGFFYGAMFVSYALSVAMMLTLWVMIKVLLGNPSLSVYLWTICSFFVLVMPYTFRFSRILMMYWFSGVGFEKKTH